MSALLECRSVCSAYGGKEVLHEISFAVRAGESIALLGPNGSGKSTLLKACCKTQLVTSGEILLQGEALSSLNYQAVARRTSFVPQEEPAPFPFLVRDIVTMGRLSQSKSFFDSPEDKVAADEAMAFTDCAQFADRPITELSGGERQRVLIARAVAQGAPLMLLDEPTSHLDIAHQLSVAQLVRSLSEKGIGVVTALHDLNLAPLLCKRAVLLDQGRVIADAPVEEVLRSPLLDETYKVRFERTEIDDRLILVPRG